MRVLWLLTLSLMLFCPSSVALAGDAAALGVGLGAGGGSEFGVDLRTTLLQMDFRGGIIRGTVRIFTYSHTFYVGNDRNWLSPGAFGATAHIKHSALALLCDPWAYAWDTDYAPRFTLTLMTVPKHFSPSAALSVVVAPQFGRGAQKGEDTVIELELSTFYRYAPNLLP